MFKRIFALLAICFLLITVAYADLAIPPDNDFFNRYENECVYLGRSFYVSGADGFVQAKNSPAASKGSSKINNGDVVYLEYSCLYNGEYWGLVRNENGWIKIDDQLLVLYDYVAFEENYSEEFYIYKGDYAELKETGAAVAWPWPGADSPLWTIEDLDTANFRVLHAYKDDQDREWGFVTYLYGSPNIWFCLSDPLNKDIPAFNPSPEPTVWESDTAHSDIGKTNNFGDITVMLIIILIAALVVGTAILIKVFWKPNMTGGQKND